MRPVDLRPLDEIFERAARAWEASDPERAHPAVLRARRILGARREALAAEACPMPIRRRIEGWLALRPRGGRARLLAGIFDTGGISGTAEPLPAFRGAAIAPRTMRFSGRGATVDLQIQPAPSTRGIVLHVAVNPACPGATVEVRTPTDRGAPRRTVLDGAGTGEVTLPARPRRLNVTVRILGAEALRIPALQLN